MLVAFWIYKNYHAWVHFSNFKFTTHENPFGKANFAYEITWSDGKYWPREFIILNSWNSREVNTENSSTKMLLQQCGQGISTNLGQFRTCNRHGNRKEFDILSPKPVTNCIISMCSVHVVDQSRILWGLRMFTAFPKVAIVNSFILYDITNTNITQ